LLHRITADAKTAAERQIDGAREAVDRAQSRAPDLDGTAVLLIAARFVETGQLANYFRASELAAAVITRYAKHARSGRADQADSEAIRRKVPELWRRVPLLVLLLGWLAAGAIVGAATLLFRLAGMQLLSPAAVETAFEFWGAGFLALVLFQFYVSVR
jgi:hypothetical protein